jgi:hypothetical protein
MKYIISLLVVLLGMSGLLPNAAAEIEIKQQQGVRYVTGGLTEEENKQMGKLAQRFPMHIVFKVAGQDEPVQGVDVTVRDISGNILLQAKSEGPLFFVDVIGGRYTVDAEYAGEKQSQTKDLTGRRYLRLRFTFNE